MKKTLAIALLAVTVSVGYSQGTVNFNNRVLTATPNIVAPISYRSDAAFATGGTNTTINGSTHATAQAALYAGPAGATEDQLVMIAPAVSFRSGTLSGFVNVGSAGERIIPGTVPGGTAVVQIRAWDSPTGALLSSYEQAALDSRNYIGKSVLLTISGLGGGNPPATAADLQGLQAFSIGIVPEPGTIALGFLGLGAMFMLRRKK